MSKPAQPPQRASLIERELRLAAVEELLIAGVSNARIDRELQTKYGLSLRQARRYVAEVRERWIGDKRQELLHRREKWIRMAERVFAKAMAKEKFSAANGALNAMSKLAGGFAQATSAIDKATEILGAPPTDDPAGALLYAQNCLLLSLEDVMRDPSIDAERRVRLVADLAAKVGMTHPRALIQSDLKKLKKRLAPASEAAKGLEPIDGISAPRTARGPRRD